VAFLLTHQSIVDHDAIGQDILGMYRVLSLSSQCYIFGDYFRGVECCRVLPREMLSDFLRDPENTVVYHHSNYWPEAEAWFGNARARVIIKYHNLTPPEYFAGYADYADKCRLGREQTTRWRRRIPQALWLGDSCFNLSEAELSESMARFAVPPFIPLTDSNQTQPDTVLLKSLAGDRRLHVLFAGRFVPNKGHLMLLSVLSEYVRRYGGDIVVNVIGKLDHVCQSYHDRVMQRAAELGVEKRLNYVGESTDSQLLSYYLGSDIYLCCSDHEGFCVPIAESQFAHLPVIAKARAAVPETAGEGAILLGDDPAEYADAMHQLHTDRAFRRALVVRGYENFARRFSYTAVETRFRFALERWMGVTL